MHRLKNDFWSFTNHLVKKHTVVKNRLLMLRESQIALTIALHECVVRVGCPWA